MTVNRGPDAGVGDSGRYFLLGRNLLATSVDLVTLRLKALACQQFLIETTNVRHGRALGQAMSG